MFAYSSRTIKDIAPVTRETIESAGIPFEYYENGYLKLGPMNKSSIHKFASINTLLTQNRFPLPPSLYYEMVVDKCTGTISKLDWREIIDGPPGGGKSMSGIAGCERYAIEAAERHGQDPKDYFTLENCALLQDTDGVTNLMDNLDKFQAVLIDDAGVSAGNRDYASTSNKNLAAIMQTCRTKRWYVVFTAPMDKQVDLAIRELVYAGSKIYKSCHAAGFNLLRRRGVTYRKIRNRYVEHNPNFEYDVRDKCGGVKINLYAAFTPDYLDPYTGIVAKYEAARDTAADALIHERATAERDKKNKVTDREKKFRTDIEKHEGTVYKMTHDANGNWLNRRGVGFSKEEGSYSMRKITSETGLSEHKVNMIIAHLKLGEKK